MIQFISLEDAKRHLHVTDANSDVDIDSKISAASEIVANYYKIATVPDEWIVNSSPLTYDIPHWAQEATRLELGELWSNREGGTAKLLSPAVRSIIPRDPTLA